MIETILKKLGLGDGSLNAEIDTRRRHIRYPGRETEVVVGDTVYPVRDWSLAGLAFDTRPDARIIVGDRMNLTVLFRFPIDTLRVEATGEVVRTGRRGTAVVLGPEARRGLERAVDNYNAQDFLQSQVA